jgi:hypothetical protein
MQHCADCWDGNSLLQPESFGFSLVPMGPPLTPALSRKRERGQDKGPAPSLPSPEGEGVTPPAAQGHAQQGTAKTLKKARRFPCNVQSNKPLGFLSFLFSTGLASSQLAG